MPIKWKRSYKRYSLSLEERCKNDTIGVMLAKRNFDQKADLNISTNLHSVSKRCIIAWIDEIYGFPWKARRIVQIHFHVCVCVLFFYYFYSLYLNKSDLISTHWFFVHDKSHMKECNTRKIYYQFKHIRILLSLLCRYPLTIEFSFNKR